MDKDQLIENLYKQIASKDQNIADMRVHIAILDAKINEWDKWYRDNFPSYNPIF